MVVYMVPLSVADALPNGHHRRLQVDPRQHTSMGSFRIGRIADWMSDESSRSIHPGGAMSLLHIPTRSGEPENPCDVPSTGKDLPALIDLGASVPGYAAGLGYKVR
jgi:hypothetical protein